MWLNFNPYVYEADEETALTPGQLDPIRVAGGMNINVLRTFSCVFAITAFEVILCGDLTKFLSGPPISIERERKRTDDVFNVSILKLIDWNVLNAQPEKPLRALCKYFEVPKTESNRAIGDARSANNMFRRPPAVGLPYLPEVLLLMKSINVKYFVTGDWRHYFYQIPISEELSRFFQVDTGFLSAQFQVLPMGFSWSPWIAQALGWTIILAREDNQPPLGVDDATRERANVPGYVVLREHGVEVGVIVLWYDNVLVATRTKSLAERWHARLEKNGERVNVVWKELEAPATRATYIGLELDAEADLKWRHKATKPEKWLNRIEKPIICAKDIAALVGILIWDATITLTPLLHYFDEINLLRKFSPRCKAKVEWKKPLTLQDEDAAAIRRLKEALRRACLNPWTSPPKPKTHLDLFLASDASDRRAGVVFINSGNKNLLWLTHRFKDEARKNSIFMKELMAILLAVRFAKKHCTHEWEECHIHIAVDNTAAIGALQKGYSPSEGACLIIKAILDVVPASRLTVKYVKSEDNSADEPSRRKAPQSLKVKRNLDLLQGKFEYDRVSVVKDDREDGFHHPIKGTFKDASRDALEFIRQTDELVPPGVHQKVSVDDIIR
jgi:hypothetical protein